MASDRLSLFLHSSPLAKRSLVMSMSGLVLLPVLFVASFTAAQRQATEHLDRIHGAIVNND